MLWTIVGVLVVLWLVGMIAGIGGGLVHLLLLAALIAIVIELFSGRRTTV